MVQVKLYQGGQIEDQGPSQARLRPVEAAPSPLATGLKAAGAGLQQIAETQQAVRDTVDEANAKHAYNQYIQTSDQLLHSGENAFYSLSGKAAVDQRDATEKALRDTRQSLLDASTSPEQRHMLMGALDGRIEEDLKGIGSHAIDQGIRYNIDESAARATLSGADATLNYLDPKLSEASIATGLGEIDSRGRLEHWSPDRISAEKLKWESGVRKDIASRFVYESDQGPEIARTYAERFKDRFTPDDAFAIDSSARVQTHALEAEQRRQEAEARREAREAAHEAGQRAEDISRTIKEGVPVPPQVGAQALVDAQASGRPALVAEIKTGLFKNNLTVEYRDHTPGEIQDHLNLLGAKIKHAGNHPDPDDVIEFDHLATLHDKSASELNSDPVSWGAAHMGAAVRPLDWNNPQSIQQRRQVALSISRRTNAPVRPLTEDETRAMAPTVTVGSIAERRDLINRLGMFGDAALPAAQQIAPSDHGFQGLVGLATSSNRAVAAAYIAQTLAGEEVLQRNPKVIDNDRAQRLFNDPGYAGGAFRLLPTTADGVFTNAKKMLAAWADQHGHSDWKDSAIADQLPGAINNALGAYKRDGVQYGGLGMWKGEKIILPDGMSQEDLETRIMRADQPSLLRGSNGVPVWANGHPLKVGEVKALHMVAVGDGIYRLTDGANYIAKQGGGFYELNVRRVGHRVGR